MHKPTICRNEDVEIKYLKPDQAMKRYSMCRNLLDSTAKEAGALIKLRRSVFIDVKVMDEYMAGHVTQQE